MQENRKLRNRPGLDWIGLDGMGMLVTRLDETGQQNSTFNHCRKWTISINEDKEKKTDVSKLK